MIALVLFTAGMAAPRTQHTRRDVMYAIGGFGVVSAFAPASKAGLLGPFPGEQPKDLGPASDGSLKACPTTPNCLSTSGDEKHSVSPFTYSKSDAMAMDDLLAVLNAYPQAGIASDGGGVIDGGVRARPLKHARPAASTWLAPARERPSRAWRILTLNAVHRALRTRPHAAGQQDCDI
jgi:hypothetical protein